MRATVTRTRRPVLFTTVGARRALAGLVLAALASVLGAAVWSRTRPDLMPLGTRIPRIAYRSERGLGELVGSDSGPTVVLVYQSTCEHCRAELTSLDHSLEMATGSHVVLITPERRAFPDSARVWWPRLASAPDVEWVRADLSALKTSLGIDVVPMIFVFGSDGTLRGKYRGEVRLDRVFPKY